MGHWVSLKGLALVARSDLPVPNQELDHGVFVKTGGVMVPRAKGNALGLVSQSSEYLPLRVVEGLQVCGS
ncbi:unnamed protein product [Linum trigynum]|uniref:Uncharacterized protein n=1 Tax=Linum trigynum TaxID=586398 RepID=A0AAV2CRX0_9ROSI